MSLSETFDHGVPIPWANMRFNNVTIDGDFLQTGSDTRAGTLTPVNDTLTHVVYTLPLPTTHNAGFVIYYTLMGKGGPIANPNGVFGQTSESLVQTTGGVVSSALQLHNAFDFIGFVPNTIGQSITVVGNNVNFGVFNSVAGQTVSFSWNLKIFFVNPSV